MWIDKIVNDTTPLGTPIDAKPNEHTYDLVRIMQEIADNAVLVGPLLTRELEALRTRLPGELKELPCLKLLEEPGLARDALNRLGPRLAARLAGEEDA